MGKDVLIGAKKLHRGGRVDLKLIRYLGQAYL